MAKLEILKVEDFTTRDGKPFKKAMIEQEGSQYPFKNVAVWSNNPLYEQVQPGAKVDGWIDKKQSTTPNPHKPGTFYNNYTLMAGENPVQGNSGASGGNVDAKLAAIYEMLVQIGEKVGLEKKVQEERPEVTEEINPEDIPF